MPIKNILQLQNESGQLENHDDERGFEFDGNQEYLRMSERKKQAILQSVALLAKKRDESRPYWESMSEERRRGFLKLRIGDLRKHFRSFNGLVEKAFLEALDFAHKNRTWRFWPCVHCDNKFVDWELQLRHIEKEHKERTAGALKNAVHKRSGMIGLTCLFVERGSPWIP